MIRRKRRGLGARPDTSGGIKWEFLIWAPGYTHRSSGIRALYRLCHHLNSSGHRAAVVAAPGEPIPPWNSFLLGADGRPDVGDAVVIYPEVVPGNPWRADKVVRWVLNTPGLMGGRKSFAESEMLFVYDRQKIPEANRAIRHSIGPERVLWLGLVDPAVIHPGDGAPRDIDCTFTHKGRSLARRIPLPAPSCEEPGFPVHRLEDLTHDLVSLGRTLRRTRTLYSYDHYSNVLREAVISGCRVRVPDSAGRWHDPRDCNCALNIMWDDRVETNYVHQFHSSGFVTGFIDQVRTRWPVPAADLGWSARLPHPPTAPLNAAAPAPDPG